MFPVEYQALPVEYGVLPVEYRRLRGDTGGYRQDATHADGGRNTDSSVDADGELLLGRFAMDSTYSVTQAQTNLPRLIKEAAAEGSIAITRHEETVAYLISRGRMDAIMETLELLGNPKAMEALHAYEAGKTKFLPLSALNGDEG